MKRALQDFNFKDMSPVRNRGRIEIKIIMEIMKNIMNNQIGNVAQAYASYF